MTETEKLAAKVVELEATVRALLGAQAEMLRLFYDFTDFCFSPPKSFQQLATTDGVARLRATLAELSKVMPPSRRERKTATKTGLQG